MVILLTQAGSLLGLTALASLGSGYSPIDAQSAALIALLGGATLLTSPSATPRARAFGRMLAWVVAFYTMAALAARPWMEAPVLPGREDSYLAQMSLVTALSVALSSVALLLAHGDGEIPFARRQVAAATALAPCAAGTVALFLYMAGVQQLYGSAGHPPPALPSVIACLLLGVAQLTRAGYDTWPSSMLRVDREESRGSETCRLARGVTLVFVLLAGAILAGGASYVRDQRQNVVLAAEGELTAIVELKASQISAWYAERQANATVIAGSRLIQGHLRESLADAAPASASRDLQEWMDHVCKSEECHSIVLFDARGRPRSRSPSHAEEPPLPQAMLAFVHSQALRFEDLRPQDRGDSPQLNLWIPVPGAGGQGTLNLGALLLRLEAHRSVFRVLEYWPTKHASAEALLIRREGDHVVFLNRPKHQPAGVPALRVSMAALPECAAVLAARGKEGLVHTRDHRGVPVLAALRQVAGTPWAVVVKMDEDEVLAGLRRLVGQAATIMLALVLGVGMLLSQMLGHYETRQGRIQRAAASERRRLADRFDQLLDQANDMIFVLNAHGDILQVNARAIEFYGYSREELVAMNALDLRAGEARGSFDEQFAAARMEGGARFETQHRRKNGSTFPAEVSARLTRFEEESYVLGVVRDLTGIRQAEALQQARLRLLDHAGHHALGEFLQATLDETEKLTASPVGFYHFLEADQATIALQVWSTRTESEFCTAQGKGRHYDLQDAGVWADCVRQKAPVIYNDYAAMPGLKGLPEGHAAITRLLSVPVVRNERIVAMIGVGNKASEYDSRDVDVVRQLADLAWDIADRVRAEGALRESQRMVSTLVSNLPGIAYRCLNDTNWTMEFISDGCRALTGYPAEEVIGSRQVSYADLILPEDRQRVWDEVQESLLEGRAFQFMYRIQHACGEIRWVWEQGRGVLDEGGDLLALEGYIVDFSERKHIEDTLIESEFHNRALLKALPDPILQISAGGLVLACDTPEGRDPWLSQRDLVGRFLFDALPQEVAVPALQAIHRTLDTHQVQVLDLQLGSEEGIRYVEARFAPCSDGTVLLLARDVTERFQSEKARRALESQLHHSQKMESLGCLAGGVAHDLNNVLGAILGLASTHREHLPSGAPLAATLDTMINACLRGRDVITGLLRFARKDLEDERPVDLNALVKDMVRLLSHTTLKRIELDEDLQEPLAAILGDSGALSHALMNLCVNAVDAMPDGGVMTIATCQHPDGSLSITVQDTGHGMSPDVLAKASEPFFTTKPVGKGTGLGLAMVYGTAAAHDGTLQITSTPGRGTTVTMRFPASRVAEGPRHDDSATTATTATAPQGRSLRILLVDDDDLIRESVTSLLCFLGHEAMAAAGGQEALQMFERGLEVDLVILDMNMPNLSGAQTLPRLMAVRPQQRVLIASGFLDEAVQPLLDSPRVATISKPFTMDEIRRKVAQFDYGPVS